MSRNIPLKYQNKQKKYEFITLLFLVGFSIFGCYKNGLTYLNIQKITLLEALKPLIFPCFSVIVALSANWIKNKKVQIELSTILEGIICGLMIPTRFSIGIFCVITTIFHLINQFLKDKIQQFSFLALYKTIIIGITYLCNLTLENLVEVTTPYSYGTLDALFGKSIGAFGTTNILLIGIVFLFLTTNFYYKKELPIYAFISYGICFFIGLIFFNSYPVSAVLNSSFFFSIVFLLPELKTSPALKKEQFIYGIFMGILSYIFMFLLNIQEGAYISLLIINFIWVLFFHLRQKRLKKSLG